MPDSKNFVLRFPLADSSQGTFMTFKSESDLRAVRQYYWAGVMTVLRAKPM
jgi:hypothetical protein